MSHSHGSGSSWTGAEPLQKIDSLCLLALGFSANNWLGSMGLPRDGDQATEAWAMVGKDWRVVTWNQDQLSSSWMKFKTSGNPPNHFCGNMWPMIHVSENKTEESACDLPDLESLGFQLIVTTNVPP